MYAASGQRCALIRTSTLLATAVRQLAEYWEVFLVLGGCMFLEERSIKVQLAAGRSASSMKQEATTEVMLSRCRSLVRQRTDGMRHERART